VTRIQGQRPRCPIQIGDVADEGLVRTFTPQAVGAMLRLVDYAWQATRPCTLPADQASLAMVAGVNREEWARLQPLLFLALDAAEDNGGATPSLLVLRRAETAYRNLLARQEAVSRQRSLAGRGNRQAPGERAVNGPSTGRQRAVQKPVSDASVGALRAHADARGALERSEKYINQERSSAEVVGEITAGLEAQATARLEHWRKTQVMQLLTEACRRWGKQNAEQGIRDIAAYPHVTPAAVELAIGRADQKALANPLGYVINATGAKVGGKALTPYLSDIPVIEKWDKARAKVWNGELAQAAVQTAVLKFKAQAAAPTAKERHA